MVDTPVALPITVISLSLLFLERLAMIKPYGLLQEPAFMNQDTPGLFVGNGVLLSRNRSGLVNDTS